MWGLALDSVSTFFSTFEAREDAFRRAVAFRLARRHAGPSTFWQDFSRVSLQDTDAAEASRVACIPGNPVDCLAFGTPRQVLTAALASTGETGSTLADNVLRTARRFEISALLSQPIRTLSGGEAVKLALGKTFIRLDTCTRVVVASPFAWLSTANHHLLKTVVAQAGKKDIPVSILALEGESDPSPVRETDPFLPPSPRSMAFGLRLSDVRIPLSLALNPLSTEAASARVEDRSFTLNSPCLIGGGNGQGKSLLARVLAGAIPAKGEAVIGTPDSLRPPCLLFQNVLTQTLLRSFATLSGAMGDGQREQTLNCYRALQQNYATALDRSSTEHPPTIKDWQANRHSLLDTKTVLVAARLAARPAALILDEPDWGMTRTSAIAFVSAVLSVAHAQHTPVLLISHKPWWHSVAQSRLLVSRTGKTGSRSPEAPVFTIAVNATGGVA